MGLRRVWEMISRGGGGIENRAARVLLHNLKYFNSIHSQSALDKPISQ